MHSRLLYLRAPLALLVLACALSTCGGGDGGGGSVGGGGFSANPTAKDSGDNSAKTDPASTTPNAANNGEPTVTYAP